MVRGCTAEAEYIAQIMASLREHKDEREHLEIFPSSEESNSSGTVIEARLEDRVSPPSDTHHDEHSYGEEPSDDDEYIPARRSQKRKSTQRPIVEQKVQAKIMKREVLSLTFNLANSHHDETRCRQLSRQIRVHHGESTDRSS